MTDFNPQPHAPSVPCPEPAVLRRLLDAPLESDVEVDLQAHLQHCAQCQTVLETLVAGSDSWSEASHLLSAESSSEPALTRVISRLEGRRSEADDSEKGADLSFLAPPRQPDHLGSLDHYEILSLVGRGGMGIVLKAHDTLLARVVAVKVMAPSLAASVESRQRFIREAQAAAAVAHDHVVTIHAVEPRNTPYLVMQFIAGATLEEKIQAMGPLEVKEILRIGLQTAAGLAAAHAQGLIHRDVKPANILLENGVQRVKITDFGLARLVDESGMTHTGVIAGTPQYMAPEQARGEPIDYRADLFSLGSVLYAMCTGQPPFRASTSMAVLRKICDEEPPAIGTLNPAIPPALIAVIERLLRKDPVKRYPSAVEVSHLLSGMLAQLQSGGVLATTDSEPTPQFDLLGAKVALPAARRRSMLRLCLIVAGLAAAGAAYYFGVHRGPWNARRKSGPLSASAAHGRRPRPLDTPIVCAGHRESVLDVVFSPDGASVISAGEDMCVRVWNSETGELRKEFYGHEAPVQSLAIAPDGGTLASGSADGEIRLWEMASGKPIKSLRAHQGQVYGLAFSPDGQTLGSAGQDRLIRLWSLNGGRDRSWSDEEGTLFTRRLAFSPDGGTLASAGHRIAFWDVTSGNLLHSVDYASASALRWDAGNRFVAAASWQAGLVALFDPADGRQIALWQAHDSAIENLALVQDPDLLITVGEDGKVRAWDALRQQLRAEWPAHRGVVYAAAVAPHAPLLATAGGGGDFRVKIWDLSQLAASEPARPPQPLAVAPLQKTLAGHDQTALSMKFSTDGKTIASGGKDKTVRLWNARTGEPGPVLRGHQGIVMSVAFSSQGDMLASAGGDPQHGEILLWNYKTGEQTGTLSGNAGEVYDVAFSPDGGLLASGGPDKFLRLYDVQERNEIGALENNHSSFVRRVLFANEGQTVLACGNFLSVYDVPGRTETLDLSREATSDLQLSPRGDVLAAAAWKSGEITLYDFKTMQPLNSWKAHRGELEALAFSPDGRYLASSSTDDTVKIWELSDMSLRAVLLSPLGDLYAIAFSPDGQTLAATSSKGKFDIFLWDVSALESRP